jgi:hypothetical protein
MYASSVSTVCDRLHACDGGEDVQLLPFLMLMVTLVEWWGGVDGGDQPLPFFVLVMVVGVGVEVVRPFLVLESCRGSSSTSLSS